MLSTTHTHLVVVEKTNVLPNDFHEYITICVYVLVVIYPFTNTSVSYLSYGCYFALDVLLIF